MELQKNMDKEFVDYLKSELGVSVDNEKLNNECLELKDKDLDKDFVDYLKNEIGVDSLNINQKKLDESFLTNLHANADNPDIVEGQVKFSEESVSKMDLHKYEPKTSDKKENDMLLCNAESKKANNMSFVNLEDPYLFKKQSSSDKFSIDDSKISSKINDNSNYTPEMCVSKIRSPIYLPSPTRSSQISTHKHTNHFKRQYTSKNSYSSDKSPTHNFASFVKRRQLMQMTSISHSFYESPSEVQRQTNTPNLKSNLYDDNT